MLTRAVKERLASDVQVWLADGLISPATADVLRRRWEAREFGIAKVVKYLGVVGGVFTLLGLLGMVAAMSGSLMFGGLMLAGIGAGALIFGLRIDADPEARYANSSKMLVALGAAAAGLGIGLVGTGADLDESLTVLLVGLFELPVLFVLAYRVLNPFLLVISLLGFFHWVGSWHRMLGRSTYEMSIQEPRLMILAALVVFAVGLWHERALAEKTPRFHRAYQSLGLVYLDMSLLILSIDAPGHGEWVWVVVFTLATIGQIVLGARLKSGLVLGFGVTFLAIDLFTRYFESFWNRMDQGLFFFLGGALALGIGIGCERLARRASAAPEHAA